jgi:hypothetical protein
MMQAGFGRRWPSTPNREAACGSANGLKESDMTIRAIGGLMLGAIVAVLVVGCAEEKLTFERWETIHDGQTPLAVEEAIGEPWQKLSDRWAYEDSDRHITATVYFNEDGTKVICKQWYDPERGWHGKNPDELEAPESSGTGMRSSTGSGTID